MYSAVISNEQGQIVETLSFDPWGKRRNPFYWSFNNVPEETLFDRGYTGHQHLDNFDLINMNGRVYDPILAQFLSPDNSIQAPDYSQSLNRYTYCLNNPLIYSDPSGEFWEIAVFAAFMYLKNAHDNRDPETGKWAWNPFSDSETQFVLGFSTNGNSFTCYGGFGTGNTIPIMAYNNQNGAGVGLWSPEGTSFHYPSIDWFASSSGVVSNVAEAGVLALLGYDELTLTGNALDKVINSPATAGLDAGLVERAMADPKHGSAAYSFRYSQPVKYVGESAPGDMKYQILGFWKSKYRDTWRVAGKELTWLIRHGTVSGWVQVNASGGMTIQHNLSDTFDLRASTGRSAEYNRACKFFGSGWHGVLGASSPTINAYWRTTYP